MAQRLATEYVKTCLVLDEAQLFELLQMFHNHRLAFKVKVLDNGDREIVFGKAFDNEELILKFECKAGMYVLEGSCRLTDANLANAMRKAVARYKGDALVNRIYPYYTLQYQYRRGAIVRIVEQSRSGERLVYELKDPAAELERQFRSANVETEIQVLRAAINEWLDRRNDADSRDEKEGIDTELGRLAHRLFVLEA